jgi:hypothetical protein
MKVLNATCLAETVTAEGVPVDAEILSEGVASSSGVLLLDGEVATYVTSSASDVKALITALTAITQKIIEIATGLDAVTVSPGTQAANIVLLTALKVQLDASKDTLK